MHIVVVNGYPQSGKDTFIDFCAEFTTVERVSSVDPAKEALTILGWDGVKTPKTRAALSQLKDLSTALFDGPVAYIKDRISTFKLWDEKYQPKVLFIFAREPEELRRYRTELGAMIIFVKRDPTEEILNHADANVEEFIYDYYVNNTGTLKQLRNEAKLFIKGELPMKGRKILVLLSGGLDSSVLLAKAVREVGADNVVALNIFYGQKHQKEQEFAEFQAALNKVTLHNADLSAVFKFDPTHPLLAGGIAVPEKSYAEQLEALGGAGTVTTYIPFRNGLFLSYATAVALQLKCDTIYYGAHADDAAGRAYPDCTETFINAMGAAIFEGTGDLVNMDAPFWDMNKAGIVKVGVDLGVDFAHTWSCYNGKEKPCEVCGTCIDRKAAFAANGITE